MKKQLRIAHCFVMIFAVILLTACNNTASGNSATSSGQNSSYAQYESSQTDSTSSGSDNTEQAESSDINSNTSSKTNSNISENTDIAGDETASSVSSAIATSSGESSAVSTSSGAHTHSYSSKKIAATCTQEGYTLKTCACGHSEKTEKVSAPGHSWGEWKTIKAATADSTGLQRRTCSRCGSADERVLEKLAQSTDDLEMEVLRLVNEERAARGLNALQYYSAGQAAADVRAAEIDTVFSHTRPNGTSCFTALDELGVKYRGAGENIAKGYPTAQAVVEGWMNSTGHRENILNANFTHLIVGVNGRCWVQLFLTM